MPLLLAIDLLPPAESRLRAAMVIERFRAILGLAQHLGSLSKTGSFAPCDPHSPIRAPSSEHPPGTPTTKTTTT
eukprot:4380661-Pleurochrysis_carterae.AAC.1